jgi:type III pantothenate kinase
VVDICIDALRSIRPVLRAGVDFRAAVANACRPAQGVGQDRLFDAAGAVAMQIVPAVVVDAGTAITVDRIDPPPAPPTSGAGGEPVFAGGAIAPGLRLAFGALHRETALLPLVQTQVPGRAAAVAALGTDTEAAIRSGVIRGTAGLIDRLVEEVGAAGKPPVLLTGGDAPALLPYLRCAPRLEPDLTLRGIAYSVDRCWGGGA